VYLLNLQCSPQYWIFVHVTAFSVGLIVSGMVWPSLYRGLNKRTCWQLANVLAIASFAMQGLTDFSSPVFSVGAFFLFGAASYQKIVSAKSTAADVADYAEFAMGVRVEAIIQK